VPLIIGAGGGPRTFRWIARHADGWMTTPGERDIGGKAAALRQAWAAENRPGAPDIRVLIAARPTPEDLAAWSAAGAAELIWGLPDAPTEKVAAHLDRLAARLTI
jgi:alkanesulfonate monooxygenase SsuD/methylene tetrahydromethanopterin reductase-like flavin-dependent oxidoreductase (luciferase family)